MISRRRSWGSILVPFFIFLWSCSRKIYLYMWYGSSESSDACSCLLRICFIYGTINVSVSQSWNLYFKLLTANNVPLYLPINECNQNTVHLKNSFIWKFSRESLLWTRCASGGLLRKKPQSPLWRIRPKISHRCSSRIFVGTTKQMTKENYKVSVSNTVFRFIYRWVEHAFLVVSFRLSKLADNIYLDLYIKKYFFRRLFL